MALRWHITLLAAGGTTVLESWIDRPEEEDYGIPLRAIKLAAMYEESHTPGSEGPWPRRGFGFCTGR